MILALLLAASGAALVPASAQGALVIDGARGAAGLRALLETAGRHSGAFSPDAVGGTLRDKVGVDLLAEQAGWGLHPSGPRALVFIRGAVGLSAPVRDAKAARRALDAWLGPSRPTRPTRQKPLKGPRAAGNRAGMLAPVAGSQRLLLASGAHAAALVSALAHPSPFSRDKALLSQARGKVWAWLAGQQPLRGAVLGLEASAKGLVAHGVVTPQRDPILAGPAPAPCEGSPPGCLRAGLGPSGHGVLSLVFAQLGLAYPAAAERVLARLEGIDVRQLSDERSLGRALQLSIQADGAPQPGPSLAAQIDLVKVDDALSRLSPLDAIRGPLAAGAYAAHLLYGALLRSAGPLELTGNPAPDRPAGAEIELRLPLR